MNPSIPLPENAPTYFPYIYTPLVAVLCYALSVISEQYAIAVWLALTFIALWLSADYIAELTKHDHVSKGLPGLAILLFPPTIDGWFFGQVNPFVLFFMAAGHHFLVNSRNRTAGTFLALASLIKISPVILIITLLKFRRWDALLYFFITILAVMLSCSLTPRGPHVWLDFLIALPEISSAGFLFKIPVNYSLSHLLLLLDLGFTQESAISLVYLCAVPALLYLAFCPTIQSDDDISFHFGAVICVMLLMSPILWPHHLLWFLIPLGVIVKIQSNVLSGTGYTIGFALSAFLSIEFISRHSGNNWLSSEQMLPSILVIVSILCILVISIACAGNRPNCGVFIKVSGGNNRVQTTHQV
jgi:hypothetical protein